MGPHVSRLLALSGSNRAIVEREKLASPTSIGFVVAVVVVFVGIPFGGRSGGGCGRWLSFPFFCSDNQVALVRAQASVCGRRTAGSKTLLARRWGIVSSSAPKVRGFLENFGSIKKFALVPLDGGTTTSTSTSTSTASVTLAVAVAIESHFILLFSAHFRRGKGNAK